MPTRILNGTCHANCTDEKHKGITVGSCCRSSQAPRGRCALRRACSGTGSGDHSHGHDPHGAGSPDGTERWPRSKSWRWLGFALRAPGPGAAAGGRPLVHHVIVVIAQTQLHVFEAGPLLHPGKGRPALLSVPAVIQPPRQVLWPRPLGAPAEPCSLHRATRSPRARPTRSAPPRVTHVHPQGGHVLLSEPGSWSPGSETALVT